MDGLLAQVSELNRKISDAEYKKKGLRQEIQGLNAKISGYSNNRLAEYLESVAHRIDEQTQRDNALISRLSNEYQLLQSDITEWRREKAILEQKIEQHQAKRNRRLFDYSKIIISLFSGYIVYGFVSQFGASVVLLAEGFLFVLLLISFTKAQDRLIQIITLVVAVLAVLASIVLPSIINSN